MKKMFIAAILGLSACSVPEPKLSSGSYKVIADKFEAYPGRYEIKVQTDKEISESDIKTVSEWLKQTHSKADKFIIFFYLPQRTGAWARVDYSPYKLEIFDDFGNNK